MDSNTSQPHYDGEDTRLTSDKELRGFYMYGWAAEVLPTLILRPSRLHLLCEAAPLPLLNAHLQTRASATSHEPPARRPNTPG